MVKISKTGFPSLNMHYPDCLLSLVDTLLDGKGITNSEDISRERTL